MNDPNRIAEITARAFQVAQSGTPGPVVVALPTDVLEAMTEAKPLDPMAVGRAGAAEEDVTAVAELLANAERPVLIAGEHTGRARDVLAQVAEAFQVPVMPVYEHQDVFDHEHPLYAGELGVRPPMDVRRTAWDADVIVAIGTRLTGAPNLAYTIPGEQQTFVHIHPNPAELGVRHRTDRAVVADAPAFLRALAGRNAPPPPAAPRGLGGAGAQGLYRGRQRAAAGGRRRH